MQLEVPEDFVLDEDQIREMQADILTHTIEALMDCAFSADAVGRKTILDTDGLSIVLSRCFEFDATGRQGADKVDRDVTTALHVEGCRIVQSLLSHAFSLQVRSCYLLPAACWLLVAGCGLLLFEGQRVC